MEQYSGKIDFLRFVSIIGVIIIHCSASTAHFNINPDINWWIGDFYDSISRFCVPIFVMISGSLILPKTYTLNEFIKKRFIRIIPPFAFWTVVYIAFNCIDQDIFKSTYIFKFIIFSVLNGAFFHLWFIYMLIGIYLITPVINKWLKQATEAEILYFLILWLVGLLLKMPVVNKITPGSVFVSFPAYLGYYVLGYYLWIKDITWKNINLIAFAMFLAGFLLTFFGAYFFSKHDRELNTSMYDFTTVNVCLMAAGLFIFLKNVKVDFSGITGAIINFISKYSFGIYLFHPLIIIFLEKMNIHYALIEPLWGVPLTTLIVLVLSIIVLRIMRLLPVIGNLIGVSNV